MLYKGLAQILEVPVEIISRTEKTRIEKEKHFLEKNDFGIFEIEKKSEISTFSLEKSIFQVKCLKYLKKSIFLMKKSKIPTFFRFQKFQNNFSPRKNLYRFGFFSDL